MSAAIHTQPGPVHLAVPHHRTGCIGDFHTAIDFISTVCREDWTTHPTRPNRTLRLDLATCESCVALVEAWHERMNEYYERHPAARPRGVKT